MSLDLDLHKEFDDRKNDEAYTDYMVQLSELTLPTFPILRPRVSMARMVDSSRSKKRDDDITFV